MEYHIISGKVVETRRSWLPYRSAPKKKRGTRKAGSSSERKISANERAEKQRLARLLNTNFSDGGYFVSFKYSDKRRPKSYEETRAAGEKLMRKLRAMCRKEGIELKRVLVNANWSPKWNRKAGYHHHAVINKIPLSILQELWPEDELDIQRLKRGDLSALASYLCDNVHPEESGQKKWSPSKNLDKPVYTEPVPVSDPDGILPIAGATEIVQSPVYDEDGKQVGGYMRCTLPARPEIKGSRVVLPKIKRGGHKRE